MKGWSRNMEVAKNKRKKEILIGIDFLDSFMEQAPLSAQQKLKRQKLKGELEEVWRVEEIRARQRSRDRDVNEGDKNTAYFFALANQRKRKKCISCLVDGDITFSDNKGMLKHVVAFYKKRFGKEPRGSFRLGQGFWEENERISIKDNEMLETEFSEEEIHQAIKGSYAEGAPGPDGFPFLFYQKFWAIIKGDLMAVVKGFEKGEVNLARLNFARINLIPKEEGVNSLKKFRPISLINCSFKIFAKALNNRLVRICDRLLAPNQTAFVRGGGIHIGECGLSS
jgi:hypothetical protein